MNPETLADALGISHDDMRALLGQIWDSPDCYDETTGEITELGAQVITDQVQAWGRAEDQAPATVGGLRISELRHASGHRNHPNHRLGDVVGHVVRLTIENGAVLDLGANGMLGRDIGAFAADDFWGAVDLARRNSTRGRWAVTDAVYRCGCRED